MNRRFGETARADSAYVTRPGAYGVVFVEGRVLITFQAHPQAEYQLPGGGIDPGETPIRALHREVREETGWRIAVLRRLGAYRRFTYMPDYDLWARKTCRIYLCRGIRPMADISEPHHSAHLFTPAEALALMTNDGDRHFLASGLALAGTGRVRPGFPGVR
jgi:8-oxo-dGTP diphosphatase